MLWVRSTALTRSRRARLGRQGAQQPPASPGRPAGRHTPAARTARTSSSGYPLLQEQVGEAVAEEVQEVGQHLLDRPAGLVAERLKGEAQEFPEGAGEPRRGLDEDAEHTHSCPPQSVGVGGACGDQADGEVAGKRIQPVGQGQDRTHQRARQRVVRRGEAGTVPRWRRRPPGAQRLGQGIFAAHDALEFGELGHHGADEVDLGQLGRLRNQPWEQGDAGNHVSELGAEPRPAGPSSRDRSPRPPGR